MFERLIDLIIELWDQVWPFVIVAQYEEGVILRLGIFTRRAKPGLNVKLPFFESVLTTEVVPTTMQLTPQTLITADNSSVVITAIVKYRIKDTKLFLLEIYDSVDVINDVVQGNVRQIIAATDSDKLADLEIEKNVLRASRKDISKYGVYLEKIVFSDIAKIKSLRLLTNG